MAVDPQIEKFSQMIFNLLYYEYEALPKPSDYRFEPKSELVVAIVDAVICRRELFGWYNKKEFVKSYHVWRNSEHIFYYYLCEKFSDFADYLDPNIFDKILIVFAFVMEMGISSYYRNNKIYLKFPFIFAKYFDSWLKKEFICNGGPFALVNYSKKYGSVNMYVFDLLISKNASIDQESFIYSLITRINKDYNFEYLLFLLNEQISKYENDNLCRKCKFAKGLTTNQILASIPNNLTSLESFLQICLKFIDALELDKFIKKVSDDLKHHANCKTIAESESSAEVDFLQPCLKCYILKVSKHASHSGQRKINSVYSKPIFLRKLATQELIKLMLDRKTALQYEAECNLCVCCFENLKSRGAEVQLKVVEERATKLRKAIEGSDPVKVG